MNNFKNIIILSSFFGLLIICSCSKKEQELSDNLKGKWNISEIRFNDDSVFNNFATGKHTIEFFGGKKAYTTTFLGVYNIDYVDQNTKDVADTFRYDIKGDQIAITSTKTTSIRNLIRYRYKIETLSGSELYLNRTPFDTTTAYLKAIK
jgi:hypothetical protein